MKPSRHVNALLERAYDHAISVGNAAPREAVLELIGTLAAFDTGRGLVRVGPAGDGGYLLPDDLDGIAACVSPGVSTQSGFDLALAERGIDVYMADASVDGPAVSHPRFYFEKKFLGPVSAGKFVTMADFIQAIPAIAPGADLILQMDIEGGEYPVLLGMDRALLSLFRIVIVELHGLENLFHGFSFALIQATVEKLLADHRVVHLHPNNCCGSVVRQGIEIPRVLEVTLYRKDRATFTRNPARAYPHSLDADNVAGNPPLVLAQSWR